MSRSISRNNPAGSQTCEVKTLITVFCGGREDIKKRDERERDRDTETDRQTETERDSLKVYYVTIKILFKGNS